MLHSSSASSVTTDNESIGSEEDDLTIANCPVSPEDDDYEFPDEVVIPSWLSTANVRAHTIATQSSSSSTDRSSDTSSDSESTTASVECDCLICKGEMSEEARICLNTGAHVKSSNADQEWENWHILDNSVVVDELCKSGGRTSGPSKNRWMGNPTECRLPKAIVFDKSKPCDLNNSEPVVVLYLATGISIASVALNCQAITQPASDISFIDRNRTKPSVNRHEASEISISWPRDSVGNVALACARIPVPICIKRGTDQQSSQCAFGAGSQPGSGWTSTSHPIASYLPAVLNELGACALQKMKLTAKHTVQRLCCFDRGLYYWEDGAIGGFSILHDEYSGKMYTHQRSSLIGSGCVWMAVHRKRLHSHKPAALRLVAMGRVESNEYQVANFRSGHVSKSVNSDGRGTWIELSLYDWCSHLLVDDGHLHEYLKAVPLLNVAFVMSDGFLVRQGPVMPFRALVVHLVYLQRSAADEETCYERIAIGLVNELALCGQAELACLCDIWTMGELCEEYTYATSVEIDAVDCFSSAVHSVCGLRTISLYQKIMNVLRARNSKWTSEEIGLAAIKRFDTEPTLQSKIRSSLIENGTISESGVSSKRKVSSSKVVAPVNHNRVVRRTRDDKTPALCAYSTTELSDDCSLDTVTMACMSSARREAGAIPIRIHALQTPYALPIGTRVRIPMERKRPMVADMKGVYVVCVVEDNQGSYSHAECSLIGTPNGWCVNIPWNVQSRKWILAIEYVIPSLIVQTEMVSIADSEFIAASLTDYRALCIYGAATESHTGLAWKKQKSVLSTDPLITCPQCSVCSLPIAANLNSDTVCVCSSSQRISNWKAWHTAARKWLESRARPVIESCEYLHTVNWTNGLSGLILPLVESQVQLNTDAFLMGAAWKSGSAKCSPSLRWDISTVDSIDPLVAKRKCSGCTARTVYHVESALSGLLDKLRVGSWPELPIEVPTFILSML
jgi:hypothetical protein